MITKDQAMTADRFEHCTMKNKSDKSPLRARRNGATKVWKTRPNDFKIPCKYGLYEYFCITQDNAGEWNAVE